MYKTGINKDAVEPSTRRGLERLRVCAGKLDAELPPSLSRPQTRGRKLILSALRRDEDYRPYFTLYRSVFFYTLSSLCRFLSPPSICVSVVSFRGWGSLVVGRSCRPRAAKHACYMCVQARRRHQQATAVSQHFLPGSESVSGGPASAWPAPRGRKHPLRASVQGEGP